LRESQLIFLVLQTVALINESLSGYLDDLVKQGQLRLREPDYKELCSCDISGLGDMKFEQRALKAYHTLGCRYALEVRRVLVMSQMLQELNYVRILGSVFGHVERHYREHIRRQSLCEPLRVLTFSIVMIYRPGEVADLAECFVL
jgi:hypothetical protein